MTPMTLSARRYSHRGRPAQRDAVGGLTLVELMIALMLGLLVVGSASAIFISNRQTYRATEGLGRVQENGRMAFELLSRDLREAGSTPCGNPDHHPLEPLKPLKIVNVLTNPTGQWWTNWNNGIVGYDGTIPVGSPANRVAGTDAIDLMGADNSSSAVVASHDPTSVAITLNTAAHGFTASDLAIICDWSQATLFQVTGVSGAVLQHNNSGTPGNCSRGLGFSPVAVCSVTGITKQYGPNSLDTNASATVVRMQPMRWFVGTTGTGGRSLFRSTIVNTGGVLTVRNQEIAEGVNDMELQYLLRGAGGYVDATAVPANRWNDVAAVRVTLDMLSADGAGVGGAQLARRIAHTVTLRNRME